MEGKRSSHHYHQHQQSTSSVTPVATPRVAMPKGPAPTGNGGSNNSNSVEAILQRHVGQRVRINTHSYPNLPESIEGVVFTCDLGLRLLAIAETTTINPSTPTTYKVLPLKVIVGVTPLAAPRASAIDDINVLVTNFKPDAEALRKREDRAIQAIKVRDSNRNKNATKEGQAIFDWFSKQYKTQWDGKSIIVEDILRIDPPYRPENLRAPKDQTRAETHMRKILIGFLDKSSPTVAMAAAATAGRLVTPALPIYHHDQAQQQIINNSNKYHPS